MLVKILFGSVPATLSFFECYSLAWPPSALWATELITESVSRRALRTLDTVSSSIAIGARLAARGATMCVTSLPWRTRHIVAHLDVINRNSPKKHRGPRGTVQRNSPRGRALLRESWWITGIRGPIILKEINSIHVLVIILITVENIGFGRFSIVKYGIKHSNQQSKTLWEYTFWRRPMLF